MPRIFTVAEVASDLGVDVEEVAEMVERMHLGRRFGATVLLDEDETDELAHSLGLDDEGDDEE